MQGRVVRKPINANLRLEVDRVFHLARLKIVLKADFKLMVKKSLRQNLGPRNILEESIG